MRKVRPGSGIEYLRKRSRLACQRHRLPPIERVLILSTDAFDRARLEASLHLLLGYGISVRTGATLGAAIDLVSAERPDVILLGDSLPPGADLPSSLAILHRLGCAHSILMSGRRHSAAEMRELAAAGIADIIERDELSASRLAEALLRMTAPSAQAAE